ncbi:methyltransferase domain-containing protein [Terasakiella sp. A23]|uniref:methyltransferase domain-containing protein n=1 Tax=Terasakiella sp. FCG-A23 TaxID=3080561 RepID=UPI002953F910|nr:methyltransferase domain-containing protein [Terasakiella sp. A23]MDV7340516.1 methyltransferase domain-containing protein [Terasakiella sp. A23]
MATWNPETYLKFDAPRLRPALDLIGQVHLKNPRTIVDLGCGPGNVTQILKERWPDADVTGIDSSPHMLEKAKAAYPDVSWQQADVSTWKPDGPVDLIYSNACLHWLEDHEGLFTRLFSYLSYDGVLAVQMPSNFAAPTHQLIRDVLGKGHPLSPGFPVHAPQEYYDWLASEAMHLNLWETTYQHILEGDNPVADWTKGAALRPVLDDLTDDQARKEFETDYRARIAKAYPKSGNGKTVMPFKRFFLIAQK